MRAGHLRHRLTFQTASIARDAYGEADKTWSDTFTVWGSVIPVRAREYQEGRQLQADVTHRVKVRYRSGINTEMRIKHDLDSRTAVYYEILHPPIEPYIRGMEVEILCKQQVEA